MWRVVCHMWRVALYGAVVVWWSSGVVVWCVVCHMCCVVVYGVMIGGVMVWWCGVACGVIVWCTRVV